FFSSRGRHTRFSRDWSSDVCSSDLEEAIKDVAASGRRAKFLYTIPTYQNPAGVTLSEERRERVLDICERANLLVVEDDPYSQLEIGRASCREGVASAGVGGPWRQTA